MFLKYFAKIRFSFFGYLWKISFKSRDDKSIEGQIFAFLVKRLDYKSNLYAKFQMFVANYMYF